MIHKPNTLPDKIEFETDVLIIGSGAGGAITAAKASQNGQRVTIVEEGHHVTQKDLNQDGRIIVPKLYRRGGGLATDDMSMRILQGKSFGGSTTINWMTSLRTPDFVLNQWVNQFKLVNHGPDDMKTHFDEVERRLSVHQIPHEDHSLQNQILVRGGNALNLDVIDSYNNSKNCIGCGTCGLGCPYNAKQDMRLTYLKDALANEIEVFVNSRAEKIKYSSKDQQETQITVLGKDFNLADKIISIKSKRVVVAASAIFSPLLLQASKLTKGGSVGKFFHVHPVTGSFARYEDPIYPTYGTPQTAVVKHDTNHDGNGYGWWQEVPDLEPFLIAVNYPGFGPQRREKMKDLNNHGVIITLVRDGANRNDTVSNGEIRWRRGFNYQNGSFSLKPIPSIRYSMSKEDKNHLLKGLEQSIKIHFAAGASKVFSLHTEGHEMSHPDESYKIWEWKSGPNQLPLFSAHPTGTNRMSNVKAKSVVNETGEMHHYPGIYVLDGSILPTAPGVNPMITILATVSKSIEIGGLGLF